MTVNDSFQCILCRCYPSKDSNDRREYSSRRGYNSWGQQLNSTVSYWTWLYYWEECSDWRMPYLGWCQNRRQCPVTLLCCVWWGNCEERGNFGARGGLILPGTHLEAPKFCYSSLIQSLYCKLHHHCPDWNQRICWFFHFLPSGSMYLSICCIHLRFWSIVSLSLMLWKESVCKSWNLEMRALGSQEM